MSGSIYFVNVITEKGGAPFLTGLCTIPRISDEIQLSDGSTIKVRRVVLRQGRFYPDVHCYIDPDLGMDICN